jgi:hypothetical protein
MTTRYFTGGSGLRIFSDIRSTNKTESTMRDYRVVMLSTEPDSDFQFVIYPRAATEREAVDVANQQYGPNFEVDRGAVTEIVN